MKKTLRALLALSICLSGWALVPFTSLPSQAFGWELFAGAYGEIFSDGFETGDTSQWFRVVGEVFNTQADSADDLLVTFRLDPALFTNRKEDDVVTLLSGLTDREVPGFTVEARRRGHLFEVRARAVSESNVWAESPWRAVEEHYGSIELEWRRSMARTEDGLLYVSIDDELLLWLVDLDNVHMPLRQVQQTRVRSRPVLTQLQGNLQQ